MHRENGSQVTPSAPAKMFTRKDLVVCLACMIFVWAVVQFWLPSAPFDDEMARVAHLIVGLFAMAVAFLFLSGYGVWRFSPPRHRFLVLGLVALPAVYGGVLLGGLRGNDQIPSLPELSGAMRAQDGLAALWWGRQAAQDLPSWTRGGKELWPTLGGDMIVSTHEDRVEVDMFPSSASPRQCERMLSDLSGQESVISSMGSWILVNGKRWHRDGNLSEACKNGGILSLVSTLHSGD